MRPLQHATRRCFHESTMQTRRQKTRMHATPGQPPDTQWDRRAWNRCWAAVYWKFGRRIVDAVLQRAELRERFKIKANTLTVIFDRRKHGVFENKIISPRSWLTS